MATIPSINAIGTPKVFFSVKVLDSINGKTLKSLRPDEDGYFTVPVAVLGENSRNGPYYDVPSIVNEITNPDTVFNKALTQGNLFGEWGHPPYDAAIPRIDTILEDRRSHHISKLCTEEPLDTGGIPVFGKIKPAGPFGDLLEKSLLSNKENTSFSLRSIITAKWDNVRKCQYRTVIRLVTFDYVGMPGYFQASKWYAPATESLREIRPDMLFDGDGKRVGLESFSDQEVANLFNLNEIQMYELKNGMHIRGTSTFFDESGQRKSLIHALLYKK